MVRFQLGGIYVGRGEGAVRCRFLLTSLMALAISGEGRKGSTKGLAAGNSFAGKLLSDRTAGRRRQR